MRGAFVLPYTPIGGVGSPDAARSTGVITEHARATYIAGATPDASTLYLEAC